MKFYYCIESNGENWERGDKRIIECVTTPKQAIKQNIIFESDIEQSWRHFYVTDEYIFYCKNGYHICLFNRKTCVDIHIAKICSHNHFIIDDIFYFYDQDDRIPLCCITLQDILESYYNPLQRKVNTYDSSFRAFAEKVKILVDKNENIFPYANSQNDIAVIHSNGGFFTAKETREYESERMQSVVFTKTDYSGRSYDTVYVKHSKYNKVHFDVCDDNVYAAVDERDDSMFNIQDRCSQIVKIVNKHGYEDFLTLKGGFSQNIGDNYIGVIQATKWMVAVLIHSCAEDRVEFYTLNKRRICSIPSSYSNIYKVADGAFVLTSNAGSYLYEWQSKPNAAGDMYDIKTKLYDGMILAVQPNV